MMRKWLLGTAFVLMGLFMLTPQAQAIPAFARKYNLVCSTCHDPFPQLNEFGRTFKEQGYTTDPADYSNDLDLGNDLAFGKQFPISLRLRSGLLNRTNDGIATTHDITLLEATHEVEVLMMGRVSKNWSGHFELEFEDADGFAAPGLGSAIVMYRYMPEVNFQFGRAAPFFADPYNSLSNMRNLFLMNDLPIANWRSANNGVSDERLRKAVQQFNMHGRIADGKVFYTVGIASSRMAWTNGVAGNNNMGVRPRNFIARLVWDIDPKLSLGGFFYAGEEGTDTDATNGSFQRYGVTYDGKWGNLIYKGMWGQYVEKNKMNPVGRDVINDIFYTDFQYEFNTRNGHPFIVPEIMFNYWEDNMQNAVNRIVQNRYYEIQGGVHAYFNENIKFSVEYRDLMNTPDGVPKTNTWFLGADLVF